MPWLLYFFLAWEAIETTAEGTGLAPGFSCFGLDFGLAGVTTKVALMNGPLLLIIPYIRRSKAVTTLL